MEEKNKEEHLGEQLDPYKKIPEKPSNRVSFIDGYGNIKTSTKKSEITLKDNQKITININGVEKTARYRETVFNVEENQLVLAPGSSGPKENPFLEIFLRGGNAAKIFQKPKTNQKIKIKK